VLRLFQNFFDYLYSYILVASWTKCHRGSNELFWIRYRRCVGTQQSKWTADCYSIWFVLASIHGM